MKRKVVQQGAATLMVSLPSKWAKKFNIKKGHEVDIEEFKDKLIVTTKFKPTAKETTLTFTKQIESAIRVSIINAYRAGYDILKINFNNKYQYTIIEQVIRDYTLGLESIKKGENNCVLESITEPSEQQFNILFKKIFECISLMILDTEQRLKNPKLNYDYRSAMIKIHKYDNFCRRVIAKQGILYEKANFYWNFLSLIIHCPRELYHLNKYLDTGNIKFANPKLFETFNLMLKLISEAYFNKDLTKIETVHELEKELRFKQIYQEIKNNGKESIVLYHLGSSIRNLYLSNSPLIGIIIAEENPNSWLPKN